MQQLKSPLRRYGGKSKLSKMIAQLLPEHRIYVEPFFGAGHVLFAKARSEIEIVSDLDRDLVNLWRAIADPVVGSRLAELLTATPNTAETYAQFRASFDPCMDQLERLRRYFVLTQCSYNGMFAGGWSRPTRPSDEKAYPNRVARFPAAQRRLEAVSILHGDAVDVLERYDSADALAYVDPPYVHSARTANDRYEHEMTDLGHANLLERLRRYRGMVLLSGYRSDLYDSALADWPRLEIAVARHAARGTGAAKERSVEVIWANPRCWASIADRARALFGVDAIHLAA